MEIIVYGKRNGCVMQLPSIDFTSIAEKYIAEYFKNSKYEFLEFYVEDDFGELEFLGSHSFDTKTKTCERGKDR